MEKLITYVGLDVHKETIAVALADEGKRRDVREHGKIANTPAALTKLTNKLAQDGRDLNFCYEAGPCGYILLPTMGAGGRVVLIGSRTATGSLGRSQYAASKAALVGLARSWAAEVAPRGITVNVVAPGATETPMLLDPARGSVPPLKPPIGRFVQPGEVAATVAFLLGADAAAITGQQIVICGGASL